MTRRLISLVALSSMFLNASSQVVLAGGRMNQATPPAPAVPMRALATNAPARALGLDGPFRLFDSAQFDGWFYHAFRDVDGDQLPDVLMGDLRVIRNLGGGLMDEIPPPLSIGVLNKMTPVDVDGDLDLDAVGTEFLSEQSLDVYVNDGAGQFTFQSTFDLCFQIRRFAVGDLDGDFDVDTVISGSVTYWFAFNDGSGAITGSPVGLSDSFARTAVAIGDLNGDGAADIVAATDGAVKVMLNDGDGGFPASGPGDLIGAIYPIGNGVKQVVIGELDGSPGDDIAIVTDSSVPSTLILRVVESASRFFMHGRWWPVIMEDRDDQEVYRAIG